MTTPHGPPMLQTLLTRLQGFLKRYLSKCSSHVKVSAYPLMVRPVMEYASIVWDPHYQTQISILEKVQRRAARWVHLTIVITVVLVPCWNSSTGYP